MLNSINLPEYLSDGRLILLSKSDQEYPEVDQTRPLVVTSHLLKIVEKTILDKLSNQLNSQILPKYSY